MKKTTRKIIFFLFLGVFLIAAPLVVFYTAGYRLNFEQMSLVKTGLFYLSTNPKGATVILDDKNIGRETTAILKNILPGEYLVRLEKEGYLPWEKKLEIKENETTFVQKAILFSSTEPTLKIAGPFLLSALDQTGENLAFALTEGSWVEIWSQNLASDEKKLLLRLSKNSFDKLNLSWLAGNDHLLLVKETRAGLETWLTIDQNGKSQTADETLKNEWLSDNQLLFTKNTNTGVDLIRRDQNNSEQTLASLPSGNYEFIPSPSSLILLQEKTRKKIFLIDNRGVDQPILLNTAAFVAAWNPQNKNQLLYASDFELHIFDAEKQTDTLLTRVSAPIIDAAWQPSAADIFYADNNNLYALELDRRGSGYQIFTLATLDKIEAFAPTSDEQTIYLVGTQGQEIGVFERKLLK
ncbi:MAG: hypothetical protein UX09_C0052G0003 [Candidatus Uhrbacteria bacterium GW2011_GWE2_45_35]|uniref:PEGA domain-containing protein n=2 Tax=Candidatus Uhriibacteriota TaxID=1752732 RepID=A0A0G1JC06_9BACT|nr:MAG: hypothetical protein UW63_C0066G0002 [Candidatus Uhrbacteria bacterium GW2011_GWF2_44_350]KKU06445.1 MAG: hypothetical protein UX09_C0052G0003 [Candidatus Uhrbacteria bacterium GW2011_GWE2_45_35]HBR80121.1 hypothetical protein [Candidatus Uhrbacteria bacterium]HCU31475.1 hypothetical protein [Candidatus Uhrbacteria bacterium]